MRVSRVKELRKKYSLLMGWEKTSWRRFKKDYTHGKGKVDTKGNS